jgi:radical SAM superfamily enzyme YgiQ (UPF0313 family)
MAVVPTGNKRIYLIQPKFPPSFWGLEHFVEITPYAALFPPLGLLTLAGLTPPEFPVELCDENAGEAIDYDTDAQIIGITGYIIQMQHVFEIADRFRALGKTVVIGGPLANLLPEYVREHCHVLFEGEAEYTWPRFLGEYAAGNPADHYVEHEKIHLPDSPAPRLSALTKWYAQGIVQCTRGCPFTCEFCDIIVMYGRKMRLKPVEQVMAEVKAWHAKGLTRIFFADDNFVGNRAYAKELLRAIIAWNAKQRHAVSFHTQASIDMARDEELLGLLRDANFHGVFIGVESPRKSSLAETKKLQNERIDLVEAIHKIQSYNLFITCGMIVGFDADDPTIFDEQFEFLQKAQIPVAMLSVLLAVPKTPLWKRLEAAGRLQMPKEDDVSHFVGTNGGTNFTPLGMTQEQLREGQVKLYRRLYSPEAFGARLLGNLARFNNVKFRPERFRLFRLFVFVRLARHYLRQGKAGRRFFFGILRAALRKSRRTTQQVGAYLGMYMHFCKLHADAMPWDPWVPQPAEPPLPPAPPKPPAPRVLGPVSLPMHEEAATK